MNQALEHAFVRDRRVWDACAPTYEQKIVTGHPDVMAYEAFEEDLLDRLLHYLIRIKRRTVCLLDLGCGSGRLHIRYGLKTTESANLDERQISLIQTARAADPRYAFDPVLAAGLDSVGGIDFSDAMIALAREKLAGNGLGSLQGTRYWFKQGSAFELEPLETDPLPVVVTLCNSIGVMQGPPGAEAVFQSLRRAVETAGGVAIISAYRRSAVESYALGNYESTMDVCGQPRWLRPDTYAGPGFVLSPRIYKRAHDPAPSIVVDVSDDQDNCVRRGLVLEREPGAVADTVRTGHIRTYTDYESYWYSFEQFDTWMAAHWARCRTHHLPGKALDALRAEPAQLAILDPAGLLDGFWAW